jgi:RNA polymerase sigma-70 factor (sigma-E family)
VARDNDDEYVEFVAVALPELWRTAYLLCGDWHRAEDAAQEALVRLYRRWSKVERREGLLPYARRALTRILIDESRRPWRREVATRLPPDRPVSGTYATVDDRMLLMEALATLSPQRRACLVLRYYEQLSVREAAQALGCSEGSVKSQTSRGLDDLRRALGEADLERLDPVGGETSMKGGHHD